MSAHEINTNVESFSEPHELRLVKLRNPWGNTEYRWNYSDLDTDNWTPKLME